VAGVIATGSHEPEDDTGAGALEPAATIRRIGPEEYDELCHRVEATLGSATPPDAVVAVISKGDPRLVEIEGRTGLHFPRDAEGRYAGYYPKTSEEAIASVESSRRAGVQFLCLPATAFWWLDHYQALGAWLNAHCHVAAHDQETCVVYDLTRPPGEATAVGEPKSGRAEQLRSLLDVLLPEDAHLFVFGSSLDGLAPRERAMTPLADNQADAVNRLAGLDVVRPTFVLIPSDGSAPPLDPAFRHFLAGRADLIARRENLCDIFQIRGSLRLQSRMGRSDDDTDSCLAPGRSLRGDAVEKLSRRLERLGLPGKDSSGASVEPISKKQR
jgi:hypothetical protein